MNKNHFTASYIQYYMNDMIRGYDCIMYYPITFILPPMDDNITLAAAARIPYE